MHKGENYQVEIVPTQNAEARDWRYAGGYSHEMLEEDGSNVELPDAVLQTHTQSLSGIVVDPSLGSGIEDLVLIPIPRDKVEKCVARKGCGISS